MSEHTEEHFSAPKLWTKPFIVLTLGYFLLFLCLQMLLSPFPAYVKERFHPNDLTISLVTSLFALTAIVSRFATAALMKRMNRNVLLFIGLGIATVATAAYAAAASVPAVLLLRVLFGVGFGAASTILPTMVSQIIPVSRMGEGIGYFGLSTSLAMSFGPMIGLSLLSGFGFPTLALTGAFTVLLVLPLLMLSRAIPAAPPKREQPGRAGGEDAAARKAPFPIGILFPALLNVLVAVTYGGILAFLALYGQQSGLAHVGLFFLFNAVTIILVRPLSGRIFDSKGPAYVLIPGAAFMAVSLLTLSLDLTMTKLIVSALLFGCGFGAVQPSLQAWMIREAGRDYYGTANGLFYNATDFGVAVGAMVLGAVASGGGYALMYRYAAGVMALFLLLMAVRRLLAGLRSGAKTYNEYGRE